MRRRGALIAAAAVLVAALAGCSTTAGSGSAQPTAAPTPSPSASSLGSAGRMQDPAAAAAPQDVSGVVVTGVSIPAIGVNAPTQLLSRDADGVLLPPTNWTSAGWYADGTLPGQKGPAVIAGHIDSATGPAVFARLGDLKAGDAVTVSLSDGRTVRFTVDHAIDVPKNDFPTEAVYGPTPEPELRLISCYGTYNHAIGHYNDNIVVYATLAS